MFIACTEIYKGAIRPIVGNIFEIINANIKDKKDLLFALMSFVACPTDLIDYILDSH